jgi:hypothetical protein
MQEVLGLDAVALPAIWDADFLYGPKTQSGEDTYVLFEINVSAVWPFPTTPWRSSRPQRWRESPSAGCGRLCMYSRGLWWRPRAEQASQTKRIAYSVA